MLELLGIDSLLSQLVFAFGLAIVLGNGYAIYKFRKGERPKGVEADAEIRMGRVIFLTVIGAVMTVWGGVSTFV